jgi:DMSO reductase anchor subunit
MKNIIMKNRSVLIYFNLVYATGLICFLILFYFNIQIIFLTNSIIIASITLLIIKLVHWYLISKTLRTVNSIDKQKSFLLRLTFCIFTYITPVYCIIQEPHLVVSHYVSTITFTIVTVLAIIGIFVERWLFFMESQHTDSLYDGNNAN